MNQPLVLLTKTSRSWLVLISSLTLLLTYWGWQLYRLIGSQRDEDLPDLSSLIRYLLGLLLLLISIGLLAHLNYRFLFRRWMRQDPNPLYYWSWLCWVGLALFEVLQVRTDHDPTFIDENILVTVLLMGLLIGYGFIADSLKTRQQQQQLLQEKTKAELAALKAQINPHFLFNALNTIYNEAQRSENQAVAELIEHLSGIMRFTIRESSHPTISVEQEFQFLEKYLALQRARLPQLATLKVQTQLDWDGLPAEVAPLLLIPFVENMFQYGISFQQAACLDLEVVVENQQLHMHVVNTLHPATNQTGGSGTGIKNARQRLALLYPNRHELTIEQTDQLFRVTLQINL
ncbi:histidine kinase [Spirosoma sp. HMF4905]|uniref:Histidine kinase n=1 Tax=Spirosoma arboris TaxID=2682092 RepID=A0A7K1SNW4_9BACT|nr:histidine kinase [Spirosoma arboris]MVM35504.1 histidine kinase [Spirosoma arboris]